MSPLDMTLSLGQKSLEISRDKDDEIWAINVVSLFNSILENIQGVSEQVIPGIIQLLMTELQQAKTPDYQIMLLQGILMCLWYDMGQTVTFMENSGVMEPFFAEVFNKVSQIKEDFEVKRFVLGLTSFLVNSEMPDSIKNNYPNIIKALTYLSNKSIELRQKALQGKQKEEMADVEEEGEHVICEDEDDINIDIDSDEDDDAYELGDDSDLDGDDRIYDSPLDDLDEVLHFHSQLDNL